MSLIIGISYGSQGLGDLLTLSPICKQVPECIVELTPGAKRFACLFENICSEIRYVDRPVSTPAVGDGHWSKQRLRALGLPEDDYFPYVAITQQQLEHGKELIKNYSDPVILISNCSKTWAHDRQIDPEKIQELVNKLSESYTVLQFGVSNNLFQLDNVIRLCDVPIEDLMCYYAAIGKYVGISTGDVFLALGVGCEAVVWLPNNSGVSWDLWNYDYDKVSYIKGGEDAVFQEVQKRWLD